jgi:hypothetical protein
LNNLIAALMVAIFSVGATVFDVLSCIGRSVLRLGLDRASPQVSDADARFVHTALKRLIPLLPPSNGFVILFGTAAMIYQAVLRGWDTASIVIIKFYWMWMLGIIAVGNVRGAVDTVRTTPSDGERAAVRRGVGWLAVLRYAGLIANPGAVVLELSLVIAR